jgi:hypothetical protein
MKKLGLVPTLLFCSILLVAALIVLLASCGTGTAASGTPDEQAARQVQEYFAGKGARFAKGVTAENIRVTDGAQGRTLSVRFVTDGSGGDFAFLSLYYGSAGEEGWTAELNQAGLNFAWVNMEFDYQDGSPPETLEVDIARQGIAGSTRLRPGPPAPPETTAPTAPSSP